MYASQKMKFPIKNFFSKCDQIRSYMRIWSHLLEKSLINNFIFFAVVLHNNLLNGSNKESYKGMPIVDLVHLYELTAKNIGLEGRRLVLALMASTNNILNIY